MCVRVCRVFLSVVLSLPLGCVPIGGGLGSQDGSVIQSPGDLSPDVLPANGTFRSITADLWSIGELNVNDEATLRVVSLGRPNVLFLDGTGSLVDAASSAFVDVVSFVADGPGEYFVLLQPTGLVGLDGLISLSIQPDQPAREHHPQTFVLDFGGKDEVLLSDGRRFSAVAAMDLGAFAGEDEDGRAFLQGVQPLIEDLIVERLCAVFCTYGMTVVHRADAVEPDNSSTVYFTNAIGPVSGNLFETTVDQENRLIFYGVAAADPGNRIVTDDAVVFVGSFLGQPGLTASVNDLVNILSHAAAHEMGHLIGLEHVFRRSDIMWGRPNVAFTRQIEFGRAQIVSSDDILIEFLFQDPERYLPHGECP